MCKSFENCNLTNQPAVQLPYWVCQFPVPAELKSTIVRDQGLFFAMPLSHFFNKEGSRYSEKYCMCALCVHWVCNNNIQGALSPESLLRPSISLLLNLRQKKKEYHIDFGMYYIVYFMDNGHEYCLLCCLLIVHILAS